MIYVTGEPAALLDFGRSEVRNPALFASYRLLEPHYLRGDVWYDVDTVVVEGTQIPFGWVPTLAVDPLNSTAATDFYNAGPRATASWENLNEYDNLFRSRFRPQTFWRQVGNVYLLTGLGSGFPPVGPLGFTTYIVPEPAALLG